MRNWSFCRCFQISRKSEKKRIRKATETGFSVAVVSYQDVVVVCVLMFLRKGVKGREGGEKKAAKEGDKNWKKLQNKTSKQTKTGGESEKRTGYGSDSGRGVAAGRGTSQSNA